MNEGGCVDVGGRNHSIDTMCAEIDRLRAERGMLRAALAGLVGVDTREELEQMEAVMRLLPQPAADKAATIDAIHALLATLESPQADAQVAREALR